ncbi:DUF6194 family protein [Tsukamurella spumae]|uniref:DUF6194 family protein n=1 Tax=Tsukamurella spumae TaxID=44753 RepID=UPI001B34F5BA|nr:DUF6194 family protein [Tsukamurella spumae]
MPESNAREAVIALLEKLPGSTVDTVAPGALAPDGVTPIPEIAWGDTFVYYTPNGEPGVMPYLTIITKDYPDDAGSRLDRAGAFRLNANVGREAFAELIGYPPAEHAARAGEWDDAADGAVIPHPLYAKLGWVSVVNPGTGPDVVALIERAHAHAQNL